MIIEKHHPSLLPMHVVCIIVKSAVVGIVRVSRSCLSLMHFNLIEYTYKYSASLHSESIHLYGLSRNPLQLIVLLEYINVKLTQSEVAQ